MLDKARPIKPGETSVCFDIAINQINVILAETELGNFFATSETEKGVWPKIIKLNNRDISQTLLTELVNIYKEVDWSVGVIQSFDRGVVTRLIFSV